MNLGMNDMNLKIIVKNVSCIVNSGAIVKHFGHKDIFESINVNGTKNIIKFCMKYGKRLLHISTISVSGNGEKEEFIVETPDNIRKQKIIYRK